MKVVHYIPSIGKSGGGVSAYLQLLSHNLGQLVELHIVCHLCDNELQLTNCKVHYIESSIKHPLKMKHEFCALLDNLKPDVVHVNGLCFGLKRKGIRLLFHRMACLNLGISRRIIG